MALSRQTEFKITPATKKEIIKIIDERIREAHVTKEDFSELKAIVKDLAVAQQELAQAQKRTEQRVDELAKAQQELAQAQKKTEQRLEELAQAQKRTEETVKELAVAIKETQKEIKILTREMRDSRTEFGSFQRTMSYAFENEAYRMLPKLLKEKYSIDIKEKFVRLELKGKEINFFAKGRQNGKEVYIVGESKLKLDDRVEKLKIKRKQKDVFQELQEKIDIILEEYPPLDVIKLLVTHFATKGFIEMAEERNIIVVQSYEW